MSLMRVNVTRHVATLALILGLFVVMLGAYTRLIDAGLGCPDWPGCYGRMVLPTVESELSQVQQQFPNTRIEEYKAWTEMAHRYAAGILGLLILFLFFSVFLGRHSRKPLPWKAPFLLILFVLFQALLGMWTVTLKLLPVVVMGHLLGGMLIFAGLCYFRFQLSDVVGVDKPQWRFWIGLGVFIVFFQIALGGWVSSNYAGVACIGFPTCNDAWFPEMHFAKGFNLFSPIGVNYQGGLLNNHVRITIQWVHRLGAFMTAGYIVILSMFLFRRVQEKYWRSVVLLAMILVLLQFALGVINVIYLLPLWVAVAHNGVAALLFATMVSLFYLSRGEVLATSR